MILNDDFRRQTVSDINRLQKKQPSYLRKFYLWPCDSEIALPEDDDQDLPHVKPKPS